MKYLLPLILLTTLHTAVAAEPRIKVETKLIEFTEAAWKQVSPMLHYSTGLRSGSAPGGPENLSSIFPELDKEKPTVAELARQMTSRDSSLEKPETSSQWKVIEVLASNECKALLRKVDQAEGCTILSARSATVKSGATCNFALTGKFRYASAYGPGKKSSVSPVAYETKNVGITLQVKPEIGPDGQTIDLNIDNESVTLLGFMGPGAVGFVPVNQADTLNVKTPVFSTKSIKTGISLWDCQAVVIGTVQLEVVGGKGKGAPDTVRKVRLLIVTASIVKTDKQPKQLKMETEEKEEEVAPLPSPLSFLRVFGALRG